MSRYYPQAAMTLRIVWEDGKPGGAENKKPDRLDVMPASVEVAINDYRTADTFSAEVEYRHFPFDPRSIRALGVTIHMQDMKKLAYGYERMQLTEENTMFIGFADESEIELDDGARMVRFKGRDQTALFLDAPWDGSLVKIDGVPVDTAIRSVIDRLKSAKEIKLEPRLPKGMKLPTLAGIKGTTLGGQRNAQDGENYWDVIQDLAGRAGLICYMEVDKIVLTVPNAMYERTDAKQFIYGRNLSDVRFTRKIGRMKDTNLRLLSLNHRASPPIIEAFIPKDATPSFLERMKLRADHIKVDAVKQSRSKKGKKEESTGASTPELAAAGVEKDEREVAPFVVFRIANARSKAHLVQIGEQIFETMSRQQIEGSFSTREMAVRDGNGIEFDLLKLRIGTPIAIRIDNDDLTGIRDIDSIKDRYSYLLKRGYDARVARELSKVVGGFSSPFYMKQATFKLTADSFSLDVDFINFIEISDALLKGG